MNGLDRLLTQSSGPPGSGEKGLRGKAGAQARPGDKAKAPFQDVLVKLSETATACRPERPGVEIAAARQPRLPEPPEHRSLPAPPFADDPGHGEEGPRGGAGAEIAEIAGTPPGARADQVLAGLALGQRPEPAEQSRAPVGDDVQHVPPAPDRSPALVALGAPAQDSRGAETIKPDRPDSARAVESADSALPKPPPFETSDFQAPKTPGERPARTAAPVTLPIPHLQTPVPAAAAAPNAADAPPPAPAWKASVQGQETHFAPVMSAIAPRMAPEAPSAPLPGRGSDRSGAVPRGVQPESAAALPPEALRVAERPSSQERPRQDAGWMRLALQEGERSTSSPTPGAALRGEARAAEMDAGAAPIAARAGLEPPLRLPVAQQIMSPVVSAARSWGSAPAEAAGRAAGRAGDPVRKLVIQLHPADLGVVTVRMRLAGDSLELHVEAKHRETLQKLEADHSALSDLLREAGYDVESLTMGAEAEGVRAGGFQQSGPTGDPPPHSGASQQGGGRPDGRPASRQGQHHATEGANHAHDDVPQGRSSGGDLYL